MENVQNNLVKLLAYSLRTGLIGREDLTWAANSLLIPLKLTEAEFGPEDVEKRSQEILDAEVENGAFLDGTLEEITDYAVKAGLTEDSPVYRDLFDTRLMGILTPRPSEVIRRFRELYDESPEKATYAYYRFSRDTNYIRRNRVLKDLKWKTPTDYGELDITINLSKPEKDPKAIAAAGRAKQTGYPKCQLCHECEGYSGRADYPARENHRLIPITIQGEEWYFQYSPYVYYNEHCIVLNGRHTPMKIDRSAFLKLFDFVKQFPHYFVGSNADLPIVGGSILAHEHFQGGHYEFAMAKAGVERSFVIPGYEDITSGIVKWPMSVIRLSGSDPARLSDCASHILEKWRSYTDASSFIFAETDGVLHSTITPIARMRDGKFELDLVLRNNITTEENPLGVFHPHAKLHHIKKENIGLIEVMGLAVLPSRLQKEMAAVREGILDGKNLGEDPLTAPHAEWVSEFSRHYDVINEKNLDEILRREIGLVFLEVLKDAGVFKRTPEGQRAFDRFTASL